MIPLDLLIALSPAVLLACIWTLDRLRHARRLTRKQLVRLIVEADRHSVYPRRRLRLPG
jgi:hypothetical protein